MKNTPKPSINRRIAFIGFIFLTLLLIITIRAVDLHIYQGPRLSRLAAKQYQKTLKLRGRRGTVYDCNRREMAVSIDIHSLAAYPPQIKDTALVSEALSGPLRLDAGKIRRKLIERDSSFVWIKRQITPDEKRAVEAMKLPGIDFIPGHSRFYPNRFSAAQVLGFTGIDGNGLEGIEFHYEDRLKGSERKLKVLRDAQGKKFEAVPEDDTEQAGQNLILTIDRTIQFITEKVLKETVETFSAKSGMAVVMDPRTGAVLAMANVPLFNPNTFGRYSRETWRNRCITDPFEPGSTMKIFCAAAAIENAGCTPDTIFYCENGRYSIGNDTVHDTKAHGWLTLQKIVKYSSNIGAIKMSEMVGPAHMYETLKRFGFGDKTGVDCPGETGGILMPYRRWSQIASGTIAFGHGISVSALQITAAAAAIANGGVLMKPFIVKEITDHEGNTVQVFKPRKIRDVVSRKTAGTVSEIMKTVVEPGGTGVRAEVEGYTVCGKTGTSKKLNKKGQYGDSYLASFIGFAPREDPRIVVYIVVDEPKDHYYGGTVAAPAFRRIVQETLSYLNVPPFKDRLMAAR